MTLLLILGPALVGLAAFFLKADRPRRMLLVSTAAAHTAATLSTWAAPPSAVLGGWIALDAPGRLFLTITSLLFLAASLYAIGYLRREGLTKHQDFAEGFLFTNAPEATFTACLLFFLSTMSMVALTQHLGLMWVGVEATTLASAPLIFFHRHHRSLEATWKYVLICSVGIALALLGNFFLAVSATEGGDGAATSLVVSDLVARGASLSTPWLKAAFLFLLVGYGTKMGLAPLHTWLPDAHSESPSMVSALLSGALLNCAFLGILRGFQVCGAAGLGHFAGDLLILFGLFSMAVAACLILGQGDYKRLLAYSSVEHMGILAFGVGIGGAGTFGALLHAFNHSFTKAMLFLVSGNILAVYRTKSSRDVQGILRVLPFSGALWIAGFLAITGTPPFGTFLSEFTILKAAMDGGHYIAAGLYLALLALVFIGMATVVLRMAQGSPAGGWYAPPHFEPALAVGPPVALGALVLLLGVYIPPFFQTALQNAAALVGGGF